MSCCRKNREALNKSQILSVTASPAAAASPGRKRSVAYLGKGTILVAGPRSGRAYAFSPNEPEQSVDSQDVAALLRTGIFVIRR